MVQAGTSRRWPSRRTPIPRLTSVRPHTTVSCRPGAVHLWKLPMAVARRVADPDAASKHPLKMGALCRTRGRDVLVELTPEGWQAVWRWVQERAREPEQQSEQAWRQHATRSINLVPMGEPVQVCMRGAVSHSGHLEAFRLRPHWYSRVRRASIRSSESIDAFF